MIVKAISRIQQQAEQRGFTVLELMTAVVVVAVLLVLALPSFRETAVRNNISAINNELIHTLNVARAEAVRRGIPVTVTSVGAAASWNGGWAVAAGANQLSAQSAIPAGYSVCGKSNGAGDGTITFSPLGALSGAISFDLNVNRPDGNKVLSRRLTIGSSGQVQARPDTTGSPALNSC
jgi:type IV fimbrial biogenesis protein FimT